MDPAFIGPVGKELLSDERFVKFEKEIKDNKWICFWVSNFF